MRKNMNCMATVTMAQIARLFTSRIHIIILDLNPGVNIFKHLNVIIVLQEVNFV